MSLEFIAQNLSRCYGEVYARRWLAQQERHNAGPRERPARAVPALSLSTNTGVVPPKSRQEGLYEHESHIRATELLEPYRKALGNAYETVHLLCRWCLEHATDTDPAPHLMTTYWVLEEALGKCERTLRRHLVEPGHPWSKAVRKFIDIRHNYGRMLDGKDEKGRDKTRTCITSMVIRFFPRGRQSEKARVKRWGRRDLLAESDAGRTRPTRRGEKARYERLEPRMSAYSSVEEQRCEHNWFLVKLGQMVTDRAESSKDCGNLYADIPKNHVLHALRQDLELCLERARARGANLKRSRSRWVDTAARVLAERHGDHEPLPQHESKEHVTHHDGFTDLWRRLLWTAVKAEMYGGTGYGWGLIERMVALAEDARLEGFRKPVAWAWSRVKEEMEALRRDYGSGMAGALEA